MHAHHGSSGPRSNAYSRIKFTNWAAYRPWSLEIKAVWKRFDSKIAKHPSFPKIIELPVLNGFIRPCRAGQVEAQLRSCPQEFLKDLRVVFILSGTMKQLKSWDGDNGFVAITGDAAFFCTPIGSVGPASPGWKISIFATS